MCGFLLFQATVVMPNGRTSASMEEPFYITAVPDPSVPKPGNEDLPKVILLNSIKVILLRNKWLYVTCWLFKYE